MKALVFADAKIGTVLFEWLSHEYRDDIGLLVTTSENDIYATAKERQIPCIVYEDTQQVVSYIQNQGLIFDLGFLIWWPKILHKPLINIPAQGFINTHPSLLPYNRGKHYNFWSIVEECPFGVTLHMVDEGVDTGDIVAQEVIPYGWEDTGETLYLKAQAAIEALFKKIYPTIRQLEFPRTKQNEAHSSFHLASELTPKSQIDLDKSYLARDLINLLRARTFKGHPACCFTDEGDEYEIRVEIKRKMK